MSTITTTTPAATSTEDVSSGPAGRFTVGYRALVAALKDAALAVPSRPGVPVMGYLLAVVDDSSVTLTAFDFETAITVALPEAEDIEPGRMLIPHAEISKILTAAVKGSTKATVDAEMVTVAVDDGAPVVTIAGYGIPLAHDLELDAFPEVPATTPGTHVLDREPFAELVHRATTAADSADLLPVLSGLRIALDKDAVAVTATDRYRLATGSVPATGTSTETVILPAALTDKLIGRLEIEQIRIGLDVIAGTTWATIAGGDVTARVRVIEGDYPRVDSIINTPSSATVTVDRVQLHKAAVRAAALMAGMGEKGAPLQVKIEQGTISLAPTREGTAVTAPALPADVNGLEGAAWSTGANPGYLVDALATMAGDKITVHVGEPTKPLKFTDDGAIEYLHLLMPVRLAR